MMKLDCFYASGYILKTQGTSAKTLGMMSMVYDFDIRNRIVDFAKEFGLK